MILYYLMNTSIKFQKDRSFGFGDIFNVFCLFSKFEYESSINLENYKLGIWSFGNLISKCNRLSEHIKHIIAIDVLYKLRNKQKDYLISRETPCSCVSFLSKPQPQPQYNSIQPQLMLGLIRLWLFTTTPPPNLTNLT